jgi:branched-chain amino acid transport system substrate-binding protein
MNLLYVGILSGIGATLTMDSLSILLWRLKILTGPVRPSLIGRWFLGLMHGTFSHNTIANYPRQNHEFLVGLFFHYSIGIALALLYLYISKILGFSSNSIWVSIVFGALTNVLPWFILFPSYGFGIFGLKGSGLLKSSTVNHLNYGLGLGICLYFIFLSSMASAMASDKRPLKIYVPGAHTGVAPFVAADILAGVNFFVDEVNKKGGLLNRDLVVIIQDDKANVEQAAKNAEAAFKDPDHLVTIGHNFSRIALPIGKLYAAQKKLFITPYATSSEISRIRGTVFQACYNDEFQGKTLATVATKKLKARKIAVLTNLSDPYSEGLSKHFIDHINKLTAINKVVVEQFGYVNTMMSPLSLRDKVEKFKPDLIFLPEQKIQAAEIVRVFQNSALYSTPFLGADGWGSENANISMYFPGGPQDPATPAYYYTYHWVSTIDTPYNKWLLPNLTKAKASPPFGPGVLAYEALAALAEKVRKTKTFDNEVLAESLRGSTFETATGKARFDTSGETIRKIVLVKLFNGKLTVESLVTPD